MGWATIFDWGVEANRRRARAEMDLVGSVLADPGLVRVGYRFGVDARQIHQDDLKAIYLACMFRHQEGQLAVLDQARTYLKAMGGWDPEARAWERGKWSEENLVELATSWPACEQAVEVAAKRLKHAAWAMDEARGCWRRMEWLLNDAIQDWTGWVGERFYGWALRRPEVEKRRE